MKLFYSFFVFFLLMGGQSEASDPKYDRLINRADKYYELFVFPKAIELYAKAIDHTEDDFDPYAALQIADSYRLMNKPVSAEKWYAKLDERDKLTDKDRLSYSQVLLKNGKRNKAKEVLQKRSNMEEVDLNRLKGIEDASVFYADSSAYMVEPVMINSDQNDFSPTYYDDGLVFVSNRKTRKLGQSTYYWDDTYFLDLFYSSDPMNSEDKPEPISRRINTIFHEGPAVFFDNGQKVIFTRNNFNLGERGTNVEGVNMLKLYYAEKNKRGKWDKAVALPFNSDDYSVGHPAMSADGKTLYFSSDMPGTYGKADLYRVTYENGTWSEPENLGKKINTAEDELFPYVSPDNVLYFASEGHPGIGGLDIYMVDLNATELKVENMGYPVNTESDDFAFILRDSTGYVSSDRQGGVGSDDIYKVHIYRLLIQARLVDAGTGEVLTGDVKLRDTGSGALLAEVVESEVTPEVEILRGRQLAVEALSAGYKPKAMKFNTASIPRGKSSYVWDVPLDRVNLKGDILVVSNPGKRDQVAALREELSLYDGTLEDLKAHYESDYVDLVDVYTIHSVYYDFDESNIRVDASEELDKLVTILKRYPEIEVMLGAHTDSRGSSKYNEKLAARRAESARTYLIKQGVAKDRITIDYFGESKPVNDCTDGVNCNSNSHQQNRRTEILIKE